MIWVRRLLFGIVCLLAIGIDGLGQRLLPLVQLPLQFRECQAHRLRGLWRNRRCLLDAIDFVAKLTQPLPG